MKILIGYEHSGVLSWAFRVKGHEVWTCDLRDYSGESAGGIKYHIKGDIWNAIGFKDWDLAVFHPPCTYLALSGNKWFKEEYELKTGFGFGKLYGSARKKARDESVVNFKNLLELQIPKICIENPVNTIPSLLGIKPNQIIQPYQFGDDASKKTCLWLKNLPKLEIPDESFWAKPRIVEVNGKQCKRWANQIDSDGSYRSPTGKTGNARAIERAVTYQGIANAMANQWG